MPAWTNTDTLALIAICLLLIAPELCTIVRELCRAGHNAVTGHSIPRNPLL